jgi:hypothetical protein
MEVYRGGKSRGERLDSAIEALLNRTYKHIAQPSHILQQHQQLWNNTLTDIKLNSKAEAVEILNTRGLVARMGALDKLENEQVILSEGRRLIGSGPSPMLSLGRAELSSKRRLASRLHAVLVELDGGEQ